MDRSALGACTKSTSTGEFLWYGSANPAVPTTTGDRYFIINQTGVIYYTTANSEELNDTSSVIPAGVLAVGK